MTIAVDMGRKATKTNKTNQTLKATTRVKSGKLGHMVNSNTRLQIVEMQMRLSRLIRIFTVCLVNLVFIPIIEP